MLEKIDLKKKMPKEEYSKEMKSLEAKMKECQQSIKEHKIPVIILFEGWSACGKGTLIGRTLYPLDPRYFNVITMNKVTEEMIMRPALWSFWINAPSEGRITIFDKSWHRITLPGVEKEWGMSKRASNGYYYDVNAFEEHLVGGGALIIKLFLHISKDEQKKRLHKLEKTEGSWRVNEEDWNQNKNYDDYLHNMEKMITETNTTKSRWVIVEAEDRRYATAKLYKTIINKIEEEVKRRQTVVTPCVSDDESVKPQEVSILGSIDLNKTIKPEDYKKKLAYYQDKIADLGFKMYGKRKSVVIVYEGWDAGGKGGNIKRLTEALDPRGYEVIPIQAPTKDELSRHYLWRFWKFMPKDGHLAIFDRSWYGRVMVERIEGFCTKDEWTRAYKEINDMELHMANHGTIIFKFWLHIDKDEQLLRFEQRQKDPLKQYKITEEDWRNREKWDLYEEAVDEMLFRTSTEYAPWTIIEANDKKYARIKALKIVVEELEKRLR